MAGKVPIQNFIYESWQRSVTWIQKNRLQNKRRIFWEATASAQSILS